ncbi:MAG: DISARM system phospholipase D-like protein DrmC [Byssovorax sp.]
MSEGDLPVLSSKALAALASASERGMLVPPYGAMQVGRFVAKAEQGDALSVLEGLRAAGLEGKALAAALRLAAAARRAAEDRVKPALVWSDLDVSGSRDTGIVCNELFRGARHDVLLSTFTLGHKAKEGDAKGNPVLLPLARRMAELPGLRVRLFVNLRRRDYQAHASELEVEAVFAGWFRREVWPWDPVPEIYYDPRALAAGDERAFLHAKCVIVDEARAFVTSANLTEAAHGRNIEAGVLLEDGVFARALQKQFESLIDRGYVRRLSAGLEP